MPGVRRHRVQQARHYLTPSPGRRPLRVGLVQLAGASPASGRTPLQVIAWWELRRIPFNLIVGIYACVCFAIYFWAVTTSGHLQPGEDAIEPLAFLAALVVAPIGINVAYTLGWMVELSVRKFVPGISPSFAPTLLKLGLGLGFALIGLPAAIWGAYRLLQLAGFVS